MTRPRTETKANRPLSEGQRRAVVRHLPLVKLTLTRHFRAGIRTGMCRDPHELFQEGCLALADAVLSHNRRRHGRFAGFAMARIRYAIAAFIHERSHLIRVPFISHRREQTRKGERTDDGGQPGDDKAARGDDTMKCRPRVFRFNENKMPPRRGGMRPAIRKTFGAPRETGEPTLGDGLRERMDEAFGLAVAELGDTARGREDVPAILNRCLSQRWTIPESESKTPIRALAKELQCSVGRITHCEERFRRKVARRLAEDDAFQTLSKLAKSHPAGMEGRLNQTEAAQLRKRMRQDRKHNPRGE